MLHCRPLPGLAILAPYCQETSSPDSLANDIATVQANSIIVLPGCTHEKAYNWQTALLAKCLSNGFVTCDYLTCYPEEECHTSLWLSFVQSSSVLPITFIFFSAAVIDTLFGKYGEIRFSFSENCQPRQSRDSGFLSPLSVS